MLETLNYNLQDKNDFELTTLPALVPVLSSATGDTLLLLVKRADLIINKVNLSPVYMQNWDFSLLSSTELARCKLFLLMKYRCHYLQFKMNGNATTIHCFLCCHKPIQDLHCLKLTHIQTSIFVFSPILKVLKNGITFPTYFRLTSSDFLLVCFCSNV